MQDELNNLTDVVQPVTLAENFTTAYTYDREGRLLTNRTDGVGRSYAYDALGNVICETDALGQSISYAYDPMGSLISTVDRNGVETVRTYDALSHETAHFNSRDGQVAGTVNTYSMSGLLLESANGEATHRYTYDSFGRVTEVIANGIRKVYTYDSGDRVTSLKVYQGSVLEMDLAYEYDAAGQLTAVVSGGVRTTYRYDAAGRLTFEENGLTGVQTSYFYTPAGQIAAQVSASGGEMLKWYAYEYDRNGNQTLKVENGQETRYYYDAIGRLEMAELPDGTTQHYTYDARGNRASMAEIWGTSVQVTTYGYDPNNRLLFSENPRESYRYEYDPQGNQTKRIRQVTTFNGTVSDETEFYWNGAGMLAHSIDPDGIISNYAYGPDGLRTRKTVGSEEIRYFYENGNILLELNGDSRITGKTVRGHRLIARETLLDTYGFLQDGHGDVTGLVSPAGELVLDYAYDPFGNETTAQTDYAATWDNPFRYCGEYWDEETQTYYLRARQYDPAAGRFLSEDPVQSVSERINNQRITNTLSLNLYVYCANNPVFYHDPSGEFWETVFDFLSFASSFKDVAEDPSLENLLFLTWDTIALAAPILPGSYVTKGVKVLDGIDEVNDSIRGIKKADDITKGLIVPEYVQSTGGFISWTRETFEKTHRVLELEEVKQLFDMASQYDVKISAHLEGHLNTKWPDPHIHLGDKRVHVAVGESTIEWISEQLK